MPVLDSSFLIDAQANTPASKRTMASLSGRRLMVPYQAALEFISGFEDRVPALRALRENFELVMPDEDQLLESAELFRLAAREGKKMSWSDVHVAAVARLEDDLLLTADVKGMRGLGVRIWDYRNSVEPPA